jgi:hypothetical protein
MDVDMAQDEPQDVQVGQRGPPDDQVEEEGPEEEVPEDEGPEDYGEMEEGGPGETDVQVDEGETEDAESSDTDPDVAKYASSSTGARAGTRTMPRIRPLEDGQFVVFVEHSPSNLPDVGVNPELAMAPVAGTRAVVTADTPVSRILAHCTASAEMHVLVYGPKSHIAPPGATLGSLCISGGDTLRIVPR